MDVLSLAKIDSLVLKLRLSSVEILALSDSESRMLELLLVLSEAET